MRFAQWYLCFYSNFKGLELEKKLFLVLTGLFFLKIIKNIFLQLKKPQTNKPFQTLFEFNYPSKKIFNFNISF